MKDPHGSWICKYCKSAQNRRLFKLWERLFHFKTFIVSYSHLFRGESLKAGNNNICVQCPVNICSPHRFIFVCKGCKSLYTVAAYEQFWRETTWKKKRFFTLPPFETTYQLLGDQRANHDATGKTLTYAHFKLIIYNMDI